MKKISLVVVAIVLVVAFAAGCGAPVDQAASESVAPEAGASESATAESAATQSAAGGTENNNDDLVGEGLGDDLGFGPVGYDMATLVERMGDKAKTLISIQMQQINEPWNQMFYDQMKWCADKYGLNLVFNNAEEDVTKEAAQMEAAVNQGAEAIVLYYVDPTAAIPAIDKTVDSGAAVITTFPAPDSKVSVTIGDSEIERGKYVAEQILKDFEGEVMNVVVSNIPGEYGILDDRIKGFEEVFAKAEAEGKVKYFKESNILEAKADEWTQSTIDLLNTNEEINCIVGAFGSPALYCAAGVTQTGKDVKVYGIDCDLAMCQQIKDGAIAGLFPYDAKANAYMSLFSALRCINGDQNIPDFEYAPQYADMWVTQDNVEEYAKAAFGEELK